MTPHTETAYIETFTGKHFHLLDPQPDEICIEDIAHALSMLVRYTGHLKSFYSVGEHSWHVSHLVPREYALWGLLHDASEAYLSDISRPLKKLTAVGPPYMEIEAHVMQAICAKFGLCGPMPHSVHVADTRMLLLEKKLLMPPTPWDDDTSLACECDIGTYTPAQTSIMCLQPQAMESLFLKRFHELYRHTPKSVQQSTQGRKR